MVLRLYCRVTRRGRGEERGEQKDRHVPVSCISTIFPGDVLHPKKARPDVVSATAVAKKSSLASSRMAPDSVKDIKSILATYAGD